MQGDERHKHGSVAGGSGGRQRRVRAVVAQMFRTPFPWAVGAGAWLFGVAFDQFLPAVGAALAIQGGTILVALRDPDFLRVALRAQSENDARHLLQRLREDAPQNGAAVRDRLDAIFGAYLAISHECASGDVPRYARGPLAATLAQMEGLAEQAAELAGRRGELSVFIEGINRSDLYGQHAALKARHERAEDPVLKAQLAQSLHFKKEEVDAYDLIHLAIARVDGQLESIECAFAALKARIFRFKSDEKTEWSVAGEQLREEISTVSVQIDTLNDSLREALALRRGA
jgi:hypothetical protein